MNFKINYQKALFDIILDRYRQECDEIRDNDLICNETINTFEIWLDDNGWILDPKDEGPVDETWLRRYLDRDSWQDEADLAGNTWTREEIEEFDEMSSSKYDDRPSVSIPGRIDLEEVAQRVREYLVLAGEDYRPQDLLAARRRIVDQVIKSFCGKGGQAWIKARLSSHIDKQRQDILDDFQKSKSE